MTVLLDTEGEAIPTDVEDGRPLFDADLCDWGDGKGPMLTINVPMFFETPFGVYDSAGVVTAPLKDVLEEYLRDFKAQDGGVGADAFAEYLRDYADRLQDSKKQQP